MSHPYTDYPRGIPTSEQRISALEKRIAKLEAQLGAATSGVVPVSAADCSGLHTTSEQSITQAGESGSGSAAAPSVSAETWSGYAGGEKAPWKDLRAACDLAAAVTRWYETPGSGDEDLRHIVYKFVRGENLSGVGT